jgi:Anti-sigma-K factor rskA
MARNDDQIEYLMATHAEARALPADAIDPFDRADLDDLRTLLADPTMWDEPSADLGDSIVATIAVAAETDGAARRAHHTAQPITRVGRGQGRLYMAGAALLGAAAATLIAIAVVRLGDDNSSNRSADARIALVGTDLLPGATGRADIRSTQSGVEIKLDVPGLPRRDGDEFYEAWLKSADSTRLVPIGTFHSGEDVTLWAGVDVADYPILTVTREKVAAPKDPEQGSSGEVVVSGRLNP